MIEEIIKLTAAILAITGSLFCFVAAYGLIRFPDLYTRMHAASKSGAAGSGLMFLAIAMVAPDLHITVRALAGIVFTLLTTPVSTHLLARAAYIAGYTPWSGTIIDELKGKYNGFVANSTTNSVSDDSDKTINKISDNASSMKVDNEL